jgi:hypothetical protein
VPTELNDKPPVLRSWRNIYAVLVSVLVVEILLMYWLTRHFS